MFDCGMHMGYQDERRYPDFSMISKTGDYTQAIDCVIITHLYNPFIVVCSRSLRCACLFSTCMFSNDDVWL